MEKLSIEIPEGYEIDQEKSNLAKGDIFFKKIIATYKEISINLFKNKNYCYTSSSGDIVKVYNGNCDPNNAPSREQLEAILALNKLCNVAKYLNGDWNPNFNNIEYSKYFIYYASRDNKLKIGRVTLHRGSEVYFKSTELAKQAIDILGKEETIKALTLNH